MASRLEQLQETLRQALGSKMLSAVDRLNELTIEVAPGSWVEVMSQLRDHPGLSFEQCTDLCGVDYLDYREGEWQRKRFAVVVHLLSVRHNLRLRVRAFLEDDDYPVIDSLVEVWPSVNWFEREAFDLFGIIFSDHPDLRRLLTDYGFIGHPFRKDFPLSGHVEMRYDPEQRRVIYQPVSIEPREVTPRIVREENYGG